MATSATEQKLSKNEDLKENSRFLRGTILEGLADTSTGAISEADGQLLKFHGSYQQDDRDVRNERRKQKLDRAYSFMVRVRLAGGVCSPQQWLQMDEIAHKQANGTLKLTTRQTFQFHGIIKSNLKRAMQGLNKACLDSIAACGDVNRNVMCDTNPFESKIHGEVLEAAWFVSNSLLPKTRAYHEIWLDGEKVETTEEPMYGSTYLPRKFKIVFAVPPRNEVDVYAHDLGFIAIVEDGELLGYNVTIGGGLGMTHNAEPTYPRLGDNVGYIAKEDLLAVAKAVLTTQRDYGDRVDRRHARLKYTVDTMGIDAFKREVEVRSGVPFAPLKPFKFESNGDRFGWVKGCDDKWHLTLYIAGGRVKDTADYKLMTGLRELAKVHKGDFRLTANQNLIIGQIAEADRPVVEAILREYGILDRLSSASGLRLNSISCVALPTCGLALAESERYLPELITDLEQITEASGLRDDAIIIRMTGCPNGCGRPYLGEIGLVGRSPGKYNLYLGAGFAGDRLNKLYKENLGHEQIVAELKPVIEHYAKEREEGERFGDFTIRKGYVKAVKVAATDWWAPN